MQTSGNNKTCSVIPDLIWNLGEQIKVQNESEESIKKMDSRFCENDNTKGTVIPNLVRDLKRTQKIDAEMILIFISTGFSITSQGKRWASALFFRSEKKRHVIVNPQSS